MINRITLNIPHSSINCLDDADWNSQEALVYCVNEWTDWHTNIMFNPGRNFFDENDVKPFVFNKSRFVVDVERLIDDDMESIGQGIVYTRFGNHLHRNVSETEKTSLYKEREQYLAKIEQNIINNDKEGYNNILIDCHSFHSSQGNVDICIGYNEDFSKPSVDLMNCIKEVFESKGYTIGINTPYSNSLQPVKDTSLFKNKYMSFMIELNKRTYLNEEYRRLIPDYIKVKETVLNLYKLLISTNL